VCVCVCVCVRARACARTRNIYNCVCTKQWRTQEFFSGGVQQIQLRTEDREDGDLGAVAP